MKYQGRSVRKRSGGRLHHFRKKRKSELGREPAETELDTPRIRVIDVRGNETKRRALSTDTAIIADGGESISATIEDVVENSANPNYVRRNIITKGAVIRTSEGYARVTSRPGQSGQVHGVLVPEDEVDIGAVEEVIEDEGSTDTEGEAPGGQDGDDDGEE